MRELSRRQLWRAWLFCSGFLFACSTVPHQPRTEALSGDANQVRDPAFFLSRRDIRRNDLCVCMIGAQPTSQQKYFKLGCSLWFTRQSCESKRRIVQDGEPGLGEILQSVPHDSKVVIGFVGHWFGADATVDWLKKEVLPEASTRKLDLRIDNTACLGGDDPTELREGTAKALKEYPVPNLEVRVNQAISSGMWDPYLPGKNNFWVEYVNRGGKGSLKFPQCRSFEKSGCWGWLQGGGSGFCEEEDHGRKSLRLLVCSKVEREVYVQSSSGRVGQLERRKQKVYEWTRMDVKNPSFEIKELKGFDAPRLVIGLKNNRYYDSMVTLDQDPEQRESSDAYFLFLKRRFLEDLPDQVHVDAGDESLEEKTVEKAIYSVDDIEIKEQRPGYSVKRFVLWVKVRQASGVNVPMIFGVYSTREEAIAARSRVVANPLILKSYGTGIDVL